MKTPEIISREGFAALHEHRGGRNAVDRHAQLPPGRLQGWRACPHTQPGCTHPWGATSCTRKALSITDWMGRGWISHLTGLFTTGATLRTVTTTVNADGTSVQVIQLKETPWQPFLATLRYMYTAEASFDDGAAAFDVLHLAALYQVLIINYCPRQTGTLCTRRND